MVLIPSMASISNLVILYEGQKKIIKVTSPNALLQTVLVEAAGHFGLEPSNCSLKVRKAVLDCSQPIRFANLSNNTMIDLIASNGPSKGIGMCRIALTAEGMSLQGSFPATSTLLDIIRHFVSSGLPTDIFDRSPQIIYMRSTLSGAELENSLSSLGLAGQAVRMQLRYSTPTAPTAAVTVDNSMAMEVDSPPVPTVDSLVVSESPPEPLEPQPEPVPAAPLPASPVLRMPLAPASPVPVEPVPLIQQQVPVLSLQEALTLMLSSNFDALTIPALTTIRKIIANIIKTPIGFREIKLTNAVVREKVLPAKGWEEVMRSIGFELTANVLCLPTSQLPLPLPMVYSMLSDALIELGVEIDPTVPVEQVRAAPVVEFDPFKTIVTRTAPQPVRLASSTDKEVARLDKKRMEIEGTPEGVERETQVLLPEAIASSPSSAPMEEDAGGPVPSALLQRLKACGTVKEVPLSTEALRRVQKAQKELVYRKTLIKIRFSDRVELTGYFHPRQTIADVVDWVQSCLLQGSAEGFVLFTTPPRTVLQQSSSTLADLQFVPVGVIHLSWTSAAKSEGGTLDKLIPLPRNLSALPIPTGVKLVEQQAGEVLEKRAREAVDREDGKESKESKPDSKPSGKPKWFKI